MLLELATAQPRGRHRGEQEAAAQTALGISRQAAVSAVAAEGSASEVSSGWLMSCTLEVEQMLKSRD